MRKEIIKTVNVTPGVALALYGDQLQSDTFNACASDIVRSSVIMFPDKVPQEVINSCVAEYPAVAIAHVFYRLSSEQKRAVVIAEPETAMRFRAVPEDMVEFITSAYSELALKLMPEAIPTAKLMEIATKKPETVLRLASPYLPIDKFYECATRRPRAALTHAPGLLDNNTLYKYAKQFPYTAKAFAFGLLTKRQQSHIEKLIAKNEGD